MKLIFTILFFSISYLSFATNIAINDTTATKGEVIDIPIYIDEIDDYVYQDTVNTFKIEIEYNALMLDFKAIVTSNSILEETGVTFNNQLNSDDYRASKLDISFDYELKTNEDGVLCHIRFEILAGPDEEAAINFVKFSFNETALETNFDSGVITIPEPVSEIDKSFLSNFYPNPFHRYAKADIRFTKPTRIKVSTYNISGADMLNNFCYEDCLEKHFRLTDKDGKTYDGDELLEEGDYLLELRNDYSTLSAGAYLIVIETDYKVLIQRFVVIK